MPGAAASIPAPRFTDAQRAAMERARRAERAIGRTSLIAAISGWSVGVFGALTLLFGVGSFAATALGAGMLVCSWVEVRGGRLLPRRPEVARRLGWNQLALGAMLIAYAAWRLTSAPSLAREQQQALAATPEGAATLEQVDSLYALISAAVYGTMIVAVAIGTGGAAAYYFTRGATLRRLLRDTPAWAMEALRPAA